LWSEDAVRFGRDLQRTGGSEPSNFVHDITRLEQTPAFVETIHSRIGTPHILVNNAGIHLKKSAAQTTDDDVQNILNATLLGAHALHVHFCRCSPNADRAALYLLPR
jgi:gluconate 5-dehydrogenase